MSDTEITAPPATSVLTSSDSYYLDG